MAYPPHSLLQFGGTIASTYGPPEVWACGIRLMADSTAGGALSTPDTFLGRVTTALSSWYGAAANGLDPRSNLTFVKCNNIGPNGKYVSQTTNVRTLTRSGGGTNVSVPAFLSLALTWETGQSRGYAHRGRIYLPNATMLVNDDAHITSAQRTAVVQSGVALLTAIKSVVAEDPTFKAQPVVVSKHGEWKLITGVSADDVYDVQRRRKNRLTATRSALPFP